MGITYLWDTNVVIYYLQKQFSSSSERFVDSTLLHNPPALSVISEIELLCWRNATKEQIDILKSFISQISVFNLTDEIKCATIDIRRTYKVKLPDALIAATALVNDYPLLTNNTKDFKAISGLHIIDPTSCGA